MSRNQQTIKSGCIESERTALITGYPDNHRLVTCYTDNRFIIHYTRCMLGILRILSYEFISLFMQNKAKVKYAKINVSSFVTSKYVQV